MSSSPSWFPLVRCLPGSLSTKNSNASNAVEIFISFVKILSAGSKPKHRRRTRKDFPAMKILDISRIFCEVQLKNMHPIDLVCMKNLLSEEASLKVRDPPFLNECNKYFGSAFSDLPLACSLSLFYLPKILYLRTNSGISPPSERHLFWTSLEFLIPLEILPSLLSGLGSTILSALVMMKKGFDNPPLILKFEDRSSIFSNFPENDLICLLLVGLNSAPFYYHWHWIGVESSTIGLAIIRCFTRVSWRPQKISFDFCFALVSLRSCFSNLSPKRHVSLILSSAISGFFDLTRVNNQGGQDIFPTIIVDWMKCLPN